MSELPSHVPDFPPALTDPRPPLGIGAIAWLIATIVVWINPEWSAARPICIAGLAVGVFAFTVFTWQRSAARRGSKSAQTGLS